MCLLWYYLSLLTKDVIFPLTMMYTNLLRAPKIDKTTPTISTIVSTIVPDTGTCSKDTLAVAYYSNYNSIKSVNLNIQVNQNDNLAESLETINNWGIS